MRGRWRILHAWAFDAEFSRLSEAAQRRLEAAILDLREGKTLGWRHADRWIYETDEGEWLDYDRNPRDRTVILLAVGEPPGRRR